jgi:hypothetical protein
MAECQKMHSGVFAYLREDLCEVLADVGASIFHLGQTRLVCKVEKEEKVEMEKRVKGREANPQHVLL